MENSRRITPCSACVGVVLKRQNPMEGGGWQTDRIRYFAIFLPSFALRMLWRTAVVWLCGMLLAFGAEAKPPVRVDLPAVVPDSVWRPLRASVDPALQKRLEARLSQNKIWASLIKHKHMAVGLVDMTDPANPRFARVNGRTMLYAASLPKIAILLASFQAIEAGRMVESPDVVADMNQMIRVSNNAAATRMIDRVGGLDAVNAVLTDPRYDLYDPALGGGLWVGRRYAQTSELHRDPLRGISHGASVMQVCRFYYLLATGRLINSARSLEMLGIMSDPGIHHKFVRTLDVIAPDAKLYRKSGTWRKWHSDSVLVWGPTWRRYILVGLVEDSRGGWILENLVRVAEEVLKQKDEPVTDLMPPSPAGAKAAVFAGQPVSFDE